MMRSDGLERFVHTHIHSDYSLLDGMSTVQEIVNKSHAHGGKYVAITDHGVMSCIPALVNACHEKDMTPIIGCEVYINDLHHEWRDRTRKGADMLSPAQMKAYRRSNHLVLLAKDNVGYANLVKIASDAWINGMFYRPRTTWDMLEKHHEGLVCQSACLLGQLPRAIIKDESILAQCPDGVSTFDDYIKNYIDRYHGLFGDDFYLEFMMNRVEEQDIVNKAVLEYAKSRNIKSVVTCDSHYTNKEDGDIQSIMLMMNMQMTFRDLENLRKKGEESYMFSGEKEYWMKTERELWDIWNERYSDYITKRDLEASIETTGEIADKCKHVEFDMSPKLPIIHDANKKLGDLVIQGLERIEKIDDPVYMDRVMYEIQRIYEKDFASYFLITRDAIKQARNMSIPVGPGRGSGAGSLINYLLGITEVDPIRYDLLFDRFLADSRGGWFFKLRFPQDAQVE